MRKPDRQLSVRNRFLERGVITHKSASLYEDPLFIGQIRQKTGSVNDTGYLDDVHAKRSINPAGSNTITY